MSRPGSKGPARKKRGNRRRTEPVGRRVVRRAVRLAKVFTIAALVPAAGYGSWLAYRFVVTTPALAVAEITVKGAERVEPARVMELAGSIDGKNIFSFDADTVAASVEEEPWVTRAVVKRRPPHRVEIKITERAPLALARLEDGSLYVMDNTGVVFARHTAADALDLPVITGLGSKEAGADIAERALLVLVGLLKTRPGFGFDSVSEIHLDPVYGLSVYTAHSRSSRPLKRSWRPEPATCGAWSRWTSRTNKR